MKALGLFSVTQEHTIGQLWNKGRAAVRRVPGDKLCNKNNYRNDYRYNEKYLG